MKHFSPLLFLFCLFIISTFFAENEPLQILMIGADPDDCDIKGGGTAALFTEMEQQVKFISVTNGDAGHME